MKRTSLNEKKRSKPRFTCVRTEVNNNWLREVHKFSQIFAYLILNAEQLKTNLPSLDLLVNVAQSPFPQHAFPPWATSSMRTSIGLNLGRGGSTATPRHLIIDNITTPVSSPGANIMCNFMSVCWLVGPLSIYLSWLHDFIKKRNSLRELTAITDGRISKEAAHYCHTLICETLIFSDFLCLEPRLLC